MIPKKPSYADSVVVPSPPTQVSLFTSSEGTFPECCAFVVQTHFLTEKGEMKLSETFAGMTVVPTTVSIHTPTLQSLSSS